MWQGLTTKLGSLILRGMEQTGDPKTGMLAFTAANDAKIEWTDRDSLTSVFESSVMAGVPQLRLQLCDN